MKTQFRPRRQWPGWHPDRGALRAFVDLVETTWSEPSSFSLQLTRPERIDTAEDIEDARRLLDSEDAFASATAIDVTVIGTSGSLDSMTFWWQGTSAVVTVAGRDELIADALKNKASGILEAGSVDPEEPTPSMPSQPIVERQTQLPLARVRFAGTYGAVHRLIDDRDSPSPAPRGKQATDPAVSNSPTGRVEARRRARLGKEERTFSVRNRIRPPPWSVPICTTLASESALRRQLVASVLGWDAVEGSRSRRSYSVVRLTPRARGDVAHGHVAALARGFDDLREQALRPRVQPLG